MPTRLADILRLLRRGSVLVWVYIVLSLFFVVFATVLLWQGAQPLYAQHFGVSGAVTVSSCGWDDRDQGWHCRGSFVSTNGTVRQQVELRPAQPTRWPAGPVSATLARPTSQVAWAREAADWPMFAFPLFMVGLAGWFGYQAVRSAQTEAREAAAAARSVSSPGSVPAPSPARASGDPPRMVPAPSPARASGDPPRVVPAPSPARASGDPPGAAPAGAAPAGLPRNRLVIVLLAGYVLFLGATAGFLGEVAAWNRSQDELLSGRATAQVTAAGQGGSDELTLAWADHAGQSQTTWLEPSDPGQFAVGDRVELRYDPEHPTAAYPVDAAAFVLPPRDRNVWAGALLVPGVVLAWAWTWRLGRWALGRFRRPQPVRVEVLVAYLRFLGSLAPSVPGTSMPAGEGWPASFWLAIHPGDGSVGYQRVVFHRRLVEFARRGAGGSSLSSVPEVRAAAGGVIGLAGANAVLRPCPGLRRMVLVEIPGVGRLWPASTVRRLPPRNYYLLPFDPDRLGGSFRVGAVGSKLAGVVAIAVLCGLAAMLAGWAAAAYLPLLAVSAWWWQGATPWGGVYDLRPGAG